MATTPDYAILARPRIRSSTFARILRDAGSPAAPYAGACWAAIVDHGVDPALALAVFRKESSYGRAGIAVRSKSWGNLRTSPSYPEREGFVFYPNWVAGAGDMARLLAIYGRNGIRPGRKTSTAQTFPFVWAPAADGNAPDRYGDQVVSFIRHYLELDRKWAPAPPKPPAPKPQPTAATHRSTASRIRLRRSPSTSTRVVRHLAAGVPVRVDRTGPGSAYTLPDGRKGRRWHRIVAIRGKRLSTPVWAASLLFDEV